MRSYGEPKLDHSGNPAAGLSYSVFAWIPAMLAGDQSRNQAATYQITYQTGTGTATDTVYVDQTASPGQWTQVGGSYFNVSQVEVTNAVNSAGALDSAGLPVCVVADAVMIVPDTMGAFGYCTPVANVDSSGQTPATAIYAANSSGRMLRFEIPPGWDPTLQTSLAELDGDCTAPVGKVDWYYPDVRHALQVTGSGDADQPSMGSLSASPAFSSLTQTTGSGGSLYIAAFDGSMRCLTNLDQGFPALNTQWPSETPTTTIISGGFTSSPCVVAGGTQVGVGDDRIYIGDINGVFYCVSADNGSILWQNPLPIAGSTGNPLNPDEGSFQTAPFGAFRYSTPVAATDDQSYARVWTASTDGHIYTFGTCPGNPTDYGTRICVQYNSNGTIAKTIGCPPYTEPSVCAPFQSSLAFDGMNLSSASITPKNPYMYCRRHERGAALVRRIQRILRLCRLDGKYNNRGYELQHLQRLSDAGGAIFIAQRHGFSGRRQPGFRPIGLHIHRLRGRANLRVFSRGRGWSVGRDVVRRTVAVFG